jgi:hypothetical protein
LDRSREEEAITGPSCGLELWATTNACAALSVSRKTWAQWQRRPGFPAPVGELGGRPVWDAASVCGWVEARDPKLRRDAGRERERS